MKISGNFKGRLNLKVNLSWVNEMETLLYKMNSKTSSIHETFKSF